MSAIMTINALMNLHKALSVNYFFILVCIKNDTYKYFAFSISKKSLVQIEPGFLIILKNTI